MEDENAEKKLASEDQIEPETQNLPSSIDQKLETLLTYFFFHKEKKKKKFFSMSF